MQMAPGGVILTLRCTAAAERSWPAGDDGLRAPLLQPSTAAADGGSVATELKRCFPLPSLCSLHHLYPP